MNTPQPPRPDHNRPNWAHHPSHGPAGYGHTWAQQHGPAPSNGAGTTALVLGIVGALLALVPLVGIIAWPVVIVGAVFGIVGLVRVSRGTATNRGAALTGLILSLVGLVVCIGYAAAFGQAANDVAIASDPGLGQADPSFAVTTPAEAAPSPEPAAPGSIPGTGTFLVGEEVEPGTYRSTPTERVMSWCYWSRLSSLDGTVDSIIANDGGDGPKVVTISPSDRAFETSGCNTWERVE
ncbi:DUF4190 domain-containing protein [Pseudonocardia sp. McavD-2-B]|uniref:DUF4190 domain-containing protein n=1 Tax=Pseudonocardia sp. McavD-2-B TaxID=2954499 RepID=UPI0020979C4E|nr:DUF4190 domain-containing protein [Pseudonocardia sp. McavD-2-B]MCO7192298.1 DUF4190 domain-containing protein [Pseudonocardia sp. McavD-2-B]